MCYPYFVLVTKGDWEMKAAKYSLIAGLVFALLGFVIGTLVGDKELSKMVILIGFSFVAIGLITLVFFGQPSGSRGNGIRIIAVGFLIVAFGAVANIAAILNGSTGDLIFDIGFIIMLSGVLYHLFIIARSKNHSD